MTWAASIADDSAGIGPGGWKRAGLAWGLPLVVTTWALLMGAEEAGTAAVFGATGKGGPGDSALTRSWSGLAWPRRRGSGASFSRLRTLLMIQVVGDSFGGPVSAESPDYKQDVALRIRKS